MTMKSSLYWATRIYTQLLALIAIASMVLSSISPPMIEAPSPMRAPFFFAPYFLIAAVYLLPYKWSIGNVQFMVRVVFYLFASVGILYLGFSGMWSFPTGGLDLLLSTGLIVLAISAPSSIFLHRRLFSSSVSA